MCSLHFFSSRLNFSVAKDAAWFCVLVIVLLCFLPRHAMGFAFLTRWIKFGSTFQQSKKFLFPSTVEIIIFFHQIIPSWAYARTNKKNNTMQRGLVFSNMIYKCAETVMHLYEQHTSELHYVCTILLQTTRIMADKEREASGISRPTWEKKNIGPNQSTSFSTLLSSQKLGECFT
jgi:hypothetical protein